MPKPDGGSPQKPVDLTQTLLATSELPPAEVAAQLLPLVYDELHALARRYLRGERVEHTLQPTALVHEAFLKLVDQSRIDWQGRTRFFAAGAAAMRRILIDHARGRKRVKRGGERQRVLLDDAAAPVEMGKLDVLAVHDALERLAALDPLQAQIVELRFFGGLSVEEVANVLGVSKRKVEGDWTHAKTWLRAALAPDAEQ